MKRSEGDIFAHAFPDKSAGFVYRYSKGKRKENLALAKGAELPTASDASDCMYDLLFLK